MDLVEIGAALRAGRQRKGLSIEAVETKIKIAQNVIIALEEGNSSKFPHPVYARGFVRSYSILLGLDDAELCAHFSREYPVPSDHDHVEDHGPQIKVKMKEPGIDIPVVRIAVGLAALILVGLGSWYVYDGFHTKKFSLPTFSFFNSTVSSNASSSSPAAVQESQVTRNETAPLAIPMPAANATPAQNQSAALAVSVEQKEAEKAPEVSLLGTRTLVVTAKSASWLQAHADEKVVDYFLRKNESASIPFNKTLSIKFGNAGGVKLELDGQPYIFDGKQGEIKTLVVK